MISISYYDFGKRKITTPYPRFPLSDNKNKAVIFIFLLSGYFVISHPQIVLWCNGSTTDSGPVCPSSNLGKTTSYSINHLFSSLLTSALSRIPFVPSLFLETRLSYQWNEN